ncbi:hypothetical protein MKEN_01039800 [Mycena kentingensis (nom. inval.)]|nr:hypothetical protein MKEN_01039800 [Mycena kentingensis (nom. inval.)]
MANYGPYPDSFLLSPNWCPQGRKSATLSNVFLMQNNASVGFDSTEGYLVPPDEDPSPVEFFGDLFIENLDMLSEDGIRQLEKDMNARNRAIPGTSSWCSVTQLYQLSSTRFTVRLCCEQKKPAMYMTSEAHPEGLVLKSRDRFRDYLVTNLSPNTRSQSLDFLERHQLLASTTRALKSVRYKDVALSVDDWIDEYIEERQRKYGPHCNRTSKAQIRQILVPHAAWLLASFINGPPARSRKLAIHSWCDFIHEFERKHRAPGSNTTLWISTYGGRRWPIEPSTLPKVLAQFGGTKEYWAQKLDRAMAPSVPQQTNRGAHPVAAQQEQVPGPGGLEYDSDFSEPSTPGMTDSEDDQQPPQLLVPSHLCARISRIPTVKGTFTWRCEMPECHYSVDLLDLPQRPIEDTLYRRVRKRECGTNFKNAESLLHRMMFEHYTGPAHLNVQGAILKNPTIYCSQQRFLADMAKKYIVS